MACTENQLRTKTTRLSEIAGRVGLEINTGKTEVLCVNKKLEAPITIRNKELACVENFTYLGSVISQEEGAQKDIRNRMCKARNAFVKLRPVWRSTTYGIRTKLQLYNSLVKSVLLYSSECWKMTETDFKGIEAFHNGCLRKILRIFWPKVISNKELYVRTNSEPIGTTIRRRRLRWLGHVLRMPSNRVPRVALYWTPQGKRRAGRPKNTWRRTVEKELKTMGLTWGEAEVAAKDRVEWRKRVDALCSR